ncbi:MAG: type II secretion system F family protein [Candidatus Eremiobacteraeota bacterium]|nr:type II secretion system F family protein [Candidatus Eremiobacteraeota bacterium]
MPYFEYSAKNKEGKEVERQISAASREKLLDLLHKEGLTPLEIKELSDDEMREKTRWKKKARSQQKKKKQKKKLGLFKDSVSQQDKAFFTRQFTIMLNAGLSLDRLINVLYWQTKSARLQNVLYTMGEDLQKGAGLSGAMSKHKDVFDEMYLSMVSVGEKSGNLPTIFERLADIIDKNLSLQKKVRAATAYPIFILIFSVILSYVLIAVFLPNFIPIFEGAGIDINKKYPLTAMLINMSNFLTKPLNIAFLLLGLAGIYLLFRFLSKSPKIKLFMDAAVLKIPGFKVVVKQSAMSRLCRSFAYLTSSGVPVLDGLNMLSRSSGNSVIEAAILRVAHKVREGASLSISFEEEEIFPDMVIQMLNVGEESGSIPEMMERASNYLDDEVDNAVSALTSMMEPAMMIVVGLIVGIFVMGILVPILTMATQLND